MTETPKPDGARRSTGGGRRGTAGSIRARVRAELTEEIKAAARRHLAADGANLSLRAVARDMDMVSSAVYRYFPSRDDLLTALIIDAYNAVGEAAERAVAAVPEDDLMGRWLAAGRAIRDWARANRAEYALIYGSPVPGYAAPQDTVNPAIRPIAVLAAILRDGFAAGKLSEPAIGPADHPTSGPAIKPPDDPTSGRAIEPPDTPTGGSPDAALPAALRADLARLAGDPRFAAPPGLLIRGLTAWIHLFGVVSFELFGHLHNVIDDNDAFFDQQMRTMARLIGF